VLETLRQPLEAGSVTIARAARTVDFPARITLVGAMNPCPCGYASDDQRRCKCGAAAIERYQSRLSGPMRDRFDLTVAVRSVPWRDWRTLGGGEPSAGVRSRVVEARRRQVERQRMLNARLSGADLKRQCGLGRAAENLLAHGVRQMSLSARGATRVIRVARTIADLGGHQEIDPGDIAEALQFRPAS
jgi:magnesium chelatase family protein